MARELRGPEIDPTNAQVHGYTVYCILFEIGVWSCGRGYAAGDVIGDHDTALCYILDPLPLVSAHGLVALLAAPLLTAVIATGPLHGVAALLQGA